MLGRLHLPHLPMPEDFQTGSEPLAWVLTTGTGAQVCCVWETGSAGSQVQAPACKTLSRAERPEGNGFLGYHELDPALWGLEGMSEWSSLWGASW